MKNLLATVIGGMLIATGSTHAAVSITNGDFEAGIDAFVAWPGYTGFTTDAGTNPAEIPGWTGTGGVGINPVVPGAVSDSPFDDPNTTNTSHFAFLQGTASITQIVGGFSVGQEYVLSLDVNSRDCCGDFPIAEVKVDGTVIGSSVDAFPAPGGVLPTAADAAWYHFDLPFQATAESHAISIETATANGGDGTLVVDNVSIVPEPSTTALGLLGLTLAFVRRRRG